MQVASSVETLHSVHVLLYVLQQLREGRLEGDVRIRLNEEGLSRCLTKLQDCSACQRHCPVSQARLLLDKLELGYLHAQRCSVFRWNRAHTHTYSTAWHFCTSLTTQHSTGKLVPDYARGTFEQPMAASQSVHQRSPLLAARNLQKYGLPDKR